MDPDAGKISVEIFNELEVETVEEFIKNTSHIYKTTHKKVCFLIIRRIYRRVKSGYRFGGVKFNGDLIIDGHHRYIAYKLANIEFEELKGGRCHTDEMLKINELELDIVEDWDDNHPKNKKYCTDEFLLDMEKVTS